MSILGANLKIYNPFMKQPIGYKLFFFCNLILLSVLYAAPIFITVKNIGFSFIILMLLGLFLFFLGQMITVIQIDILSKPFTFCLPNHNKIPRQIIFLIGIGITTLYSIALLQLPFKSELKHLMIITSPVIVMAFYFLPVCFTLFLQNEKGNLFVLSIFGLLIVLVWITFIKHDYFEYTAQELIHYCFVPLLISLIAFVIAAWNMLGKPELKRISHGKDVKMMVAFYTRPLNRNTLEEVSSALRLSKKPKQENDKLDIFIDKMKTRPYFRLQHSFWGTLFFLTSYGFNQNNRSPVKSFSTIIVLGFIALILSGYQPYSEKSILPDNVALNWVQIIVLMCISTIFEGLFRTPSHNHLLPVSRQQQFRINLFIFLCKPVFILLWFSIAIAVSWSLQHIMPGIKLMGNYFTYHFVGTQMIILPLVIIPISSICSSFVKSFGLFLLIIMCSSGVGGAVLAMIKVHVLNLQITMIILAFITNTLFMALLNWHWFKRDHV